MFQLSDKTYEILVKIQRFLPFLGAAYLALAEVWGLSFGNEINKTIAIIASVLAAFIEICIATYNKEKKNGNS